MILAFFAAAFADEVRQPPVLPPEVPAHQQRASLTGLRYADLQAGTGELAEAGARIRVDYTLWLADGTQVDSSLSRGKPLEITIGVGAVIKGWDEGVLGMRAGGKRVLFVPSALGYGARTSGSIPPNSDLVFEIDLLAVTETARKPPEAPTPVQQYQTTESGLQWADLVVGTGKSPVPGNTVVVEYTGWIDGERFDSSLARDAPLVVAIGQGAVIKGWDEGVLSMQEGGVRQLRIPPELGYGGRGAPPTIPPNAPLLFEVELVEVRVPSVP